MNIDFNDPSMLDSYLCRTQSLSEQLANVCGRTEKTSNGHNYDNIEEEIDAFDPEKLPSDADILLHWETLKERHETLYELAMAVFGIPPTEVQIERDFSHLENILSNRRYNLSPDFLS